jgi:hypothetical protein
MSIQSFICFIGQNSTGSRTASLAEVGDEVVSAQAIGNNGAIAQGADLTSYFESSITVAGQIQQTSNIAGGSIAVLALLARGV